MNQLDRMRSLEQIKMFLHVSQTPPASIRINSNPNPLPQLPPLDDGCGTCLICNQKRKFVSATACPLSMFQSVRRPPPRSSLPVCPHLCCCLCPCLCCCLCQARLLWRWVRSLLSILLLPLLLFELLLLFACVNGARSSRSFAALQAHLHLHIVLVPPGARGKRVGKLCHRLRTGCA